MTTRTGMTRTCSPSGCQAHGLKAVVIVVVVSQCNAGATWGAKAL